MLIKYLSLNPLVLYSQLERPVDWSKYFGREAPLEIEIGFGLGDFLVHKASQYPDHNFLGVELQWRPVKSTLRKIALRKLTNIRLLQLHAEVVLKYFIEPRSVGRIYSLFPYPWPKHKHEGNRLFSTEVLRLMNNRLVDGGEFYMVTDQKPFWEWVIEQSRKAGFKMLKRTIAPQFGTKFEKIWQSQGQKEFFELTLKKEDHCEIPEDKENAVKAFYMDHFEPDSFKPQDEVGAPLTVRFGDFLFDPKVQKGMLLATAVEDDFVQRFWIEIVPQGTRWALHIAQGCFVLPTKGVSRALDLVSQTVISGSKIIPPNSKS